MRRKSKIKNLFGFAAILSLALLPPPILTGAERTKADEALVDNVQKSYDSAADFTADFRQETEIKTLNRNLKASGKVYFKRPGKMLWRYDEPKGQVVLADGKNFYFYQPDQGQVIKGPLKNAFRSDVPLSFLLGLGNLKRDFEVSSKGVEREHHVLVLRPKGELKGVSEIELGVEPKSFDIAWSRIRDASGSLITVRFSNLRKGVGVQDSLFQFKVPDGVDVVELKSE
jgi:outer membrane lipoprotein carrier protein